MIGDDEQSWFRKVDADLVRQYLEESKEQQLRKRLIRLDFRGSHEKLDSQIEILSAIDDEWQVLMSLQHLPKVASLAETRRGLKPQDTKGLSDNSDASDSKSSWLWLKSWLRVVKAWSSRASIASNSLKFASMRWRIVATYWVNLHQCSDG